ncbi:2738_t:CDS:2 [Acaulospora morrowiae]|uniref:2738_t:CDS:1 n=1 Tax=Acaulospora morrowiae TaxID=94023 RepID=A0A9N8V4V8_9GLOM|nr:2738_t:CDS:2 [Acaulospora morrowiae]
MEMENDAVDSQNSENDFVIFHDGDNFSTAEAETTMFNSSSCEEGSGESEYEEEESYIILDLGTEVTLDMITTNDSLKNIYNPSTYHFTSFAASNFPVRPPDKNNGGSGEGSSGTQVAVDPSAENVAIDNESAESKQTEKEEITYSLIGLDTESPRLRIGNMHFKGEYDESVGTDLIFLQDPDPSNPRQQMLTYNCHTTKKIVFSRVSLQPSSKAKNPEEVDRLEDEYFKGGRNYWDDMSRSEATRKYSHEEPWVIDREGENDSLENPPVDKGKGKEVDLSDNEYQSNRMLID